MTIAHTQQDVLTDDGFAIAASFFSPPAPKASVLIVPAMGVPQKFYAAFAEWLAAQDYLVATFDYRGIGRSRRTPLRGFHADIIDDWARRDCAAMIDALDERLPQGQITWIGHSLGAQILPFVPNVARLSRAVTLAAGAGYWRENPKRLRHIVWLLWYVIVPVSLRLFGYFPGGRLGMVGDLPRRVMAQWSRWCLDPEYVVGAEGETARDRFAAVTTPLVSLSFTDDEFMSARNTESLHGFYVNAPKKAIRLSPADAGVKHIGHFGFFREKHKDALWEKFLLPELASKLA